LGQLISIFSKAIEWKMIRENPAKEVKLFKGIKKRVRYIMPEEIQNLISNCPEYLKPIVTIAVHTGMRKGEILGLRRDQVDFEQRIITLTDTKNSEIRNIPMNETVKAILNSIEKKDGPIFHVGLSTMRKDYIEALKKSNIENFTFHGLRHTFASHLAMQGTELNDIRDLLGHKSINMTLRYAHLSPAHKSKAVTILDTLMTQIPPQEIVEEAKVLEFKRKIV
jgi:integrase